MRAVRYDYIKQVVQLNIYAVTLLLLICIPLYLYASYFYFFYFIPSFSHSLFLPAANPPPSVRIISRAHNVYCLRIPAFFFSFFFHFRFRFVWRLALGEWMCRTENAELKINRTQRGWRWMGARSQSRKHTHYRTTTTSAEAERNI